MDKKIWLNKNILVLGFAKSGYQVAKLLNQLGAIVTVNDSKDLRNDLDAKKLEEKGVVILSGGHPKGLLNSNYDVIVKNPGIPYDHPLIEEAIAKNIPIITEVEVATNIMKGHIIGITGTNGKTTTTTILQEMLNEERKNGVSLAVGNIGIPTSECALDVNKEDDIIIELSSFQLMGTPTIHPEIAVITNIYSDHLDYHKTQENYEEAKLNLVKNMDSSDIVIYNNDQKGLKSKIKKHTTAQLIPFSRKEYLKNGVSIKDSNIYFNQEKIMNISEIFIPGLHNIENMLAAITVAKIKGVSNVIIKKIANTFGGVKHRTQFVGEFNQRFFYNDSKATNPESTINALKSFESPVILLAGGLDRGSDFECLEADFKKHVRTLITFGETAEKINKIGKKAGLSEIYTVNSMDDAVEKAYSLSQEKDIILLSPAAASWDQYADFEERGEEYMASVAKIVQNKKE